MDGVREARCGHDPLAGGGGKPLGTAEESRNDWAATVTDREWGLARALHDLCWAVAEYTTAKQSYQDSQGDAERDPLGRAWSAANDRLLLAFQGATAALDEVRAELTRHGYGAP